MEHQTHLEPSDSHEPTISHDFSSAPASPEPQPTPPPAPPIAAPSIPTPPPAPIYQPEPVAASMGGAAPAATTDHGTNSAGVIILQWLTYAFWGWTVLALSVLTTSVLANLIADADTGGFTPYAIAAVLVLLPISLVCDFFYSKQEPQKKTGSAMIVMVIHAVIFALFAIGSLIFAVFNIVSLLTDSSDHPTVKVSLYSTILITIIYGATFIRTLNPARFRWVRKVFLIFMLVLVGLIAVLGVTGPVAKARLTKDDKLIQNNIYSVNTSINSYARTNKKLPEKLSDLSLQGDAKQLVDKNLVRYTPNTYQSPTPASAKPSTTTKQTTTYSTLSTSSTYYYTLCATYKRESSGYKERYSSPYSGSDGYTTSPDSYSHPAGEVCYKLKTTNYSYDY